MSLVKSYKILLQIYTQILKSQEILQYIFMFFYKSFIYKGLEMQYFATYFMTWPELIESIVREFRCSEPELAQRTGITYPTIARIRAGKTKKPTQAIIKSLENGLNIKIDDSDPEKLTYKLISEVKEAVSGYGVPEMNKEDLELLSKLKEMGIDTVEKLEKFYNLEDIAEDIKELLKKKLRN